MQSLEQEHGRRSCPESFVAMALKQNQPTWNEKRRSWEFKCSHCGFSFYRRSPRSNVYYCQNACRQAAYRERQNMSVGPEVLK